MTRLCNWVCVLGVGAYAASPAAGVWPFDQTPSIEAGEILARVTERYDTLTDFQAQLTVVTSSAYLGDTSSRSGVLYARTPNLLHVEFVDPYAQTIVFDGEYMYAYAEGADQVIRFAGSEATYFVDLPRIFESLSTDYDVRLAAETAGRTYELRLKSLTTSAPFPEIRLWVDRDRFLARRADFYDSGRNCTSYRFADYRLNPGLPASLFEFEVPPGVEVVDMGGSHQP